MAPSDGVETQQQTAPPDSGWISVGLSLVHGEGKAPCDLFRNVGPGRYVLLAQKGLPIDRSLPQKLKAQGQNRLYIPEVDAHLYFKRLSETTAGIVAGPNTSPEKKAAFVYHSCREVLQKVFEDPRAAFINSAIDVVAPTMDLIVSDDAATKCLFKLTNYDESTYTHSTNVGIFGIALARHVYGPEAIGKLRSLGAGFFLHDLGKCRLPHEIINKPGALTDQERNIIKRHPRAGYSILQNTGVMTEEIKILTMQHHEKDDGTGYPQGLKKDDIHPYARICRIVDIYEALTAKRSYHQPRSSFEALKMMKEHIVTDIDQELFGHFLKFFLS